MYGTIAKFSPEIGVGIIVAEDGSRYRFSARRVVNGHEMRPGRQVDFVLEGRAAADVIVLAGSPWHVFAAPRSSRRTIEAMPAAEPMRLAA
jgi:hypothetical protein